SLLKDFMHDRYAISVTFQHGYCQQNDLFKFSEVSSFHEQSISSIFADQIACQRYKESFFNRILRIVNQRLQEWLSGIMALLSAGGWYDVRHLRVSMTQAAT